MSRAIFSRWSRSNSASIYRGHRLYSTSDASPKNHSPARKLTAHAVTAGVFSTVGFWWATTDEKLPSTDNSVGTSDCSPAAITKVLSRNAHSRTIRDVSGVGRYDVAQLAANSPCEDRFVDGNLSFSRTSKQLMAWGVFDGHAGCQTADLLTKELLPVVQARLEQGETSDGALSDESVQQAIMKAFVDFDDSMIVTASSTAESNLPLHGKMQKLVPAFAGSCALLSVYDPNTTKLHVACTGDSRAVLGQKQPDGKWRATPLSVDQNAKNEDEVKRINAEHPGEEGIVKDGRVLGLVVSRAFGDGRWKWPVDMQKRFVRQFYGYPPLPGVDTPPYLTAEPVVTTTALDPKTPSFLIMASDGLWDLVSNDEAVGLVEAWLSTREISTKQEQIPKNESFDFSHFWKDVYWKFEEDRTTVQDKNVAVHLMRNALGGNHQEMIAGRLTLGTPFSRRLRDDITVQVVFFNVPGIERK